MRSCIHFQLDFLRDEEGLRFRKEFSNYNDDAMLHGVIKRLKVLSTGMNEH